MMDTLTKAQQAAAQAHRQLQVHVLPNAGHWLHADNPVGLSKLLFPWLVQAGGGQHLQSAAVQAA